MMLIRSIELLVIDEISMVRSDVLDAVDEVLKTIRRDRRPFGGVQLLMIGDIQQLSPICRDEEWQLLSPHYTSPYFFDSKALKECSYITIELKKIYRQTEQEFTKILNAVRDNSITQHVMESLNSRYIANFSPRDDEGYITLATHNSSANTINSSKLAALRSEPKYYDATIESDYPEWAYPNDESLELKVGTQVMFIKNDPSVEKLYYNGMVGTVEQLLSGSVVVRPNNGGKSIDVDPVTWENIDYVLNSQSGEIEERVKGSYTQIPLKCAWAITIHKSQGLSFDRVIIDAENSFAHGQVYVALSRCRTFEGMVLSSPLRIHSIVKDRTVEEFNQRVLSSVPDEAELTRYKREYFKELLCEIFSYNSIDRALYSLTKIFEMSLFKEYPKLCTSIREALSVEQSEVYKVAESFKVQITRAIEASENYSDDPFIKERLQKSYIYFSSRLEAISNITEQISTVVIDAKDIKKRVRSLLDELQEELAIKRFSIELCNKGFSCEAYLKRKFEIITQRSTTPQAVEKSPTKKKRASEDIINQELYETLVLWRKQLAEESDKPAYTIITNRTIIEIQATLPTTIDMVKRVAGIGPSKISAYGDQIVDLVQDYVVTNNIDIEAYYANEEGLVEIETKPKSEPTPKSDEPKVATHIQTLNLHRAGKSPDEIASIRELSVGTIYNHLIQNLKLNNITLEGVLDDELILKIRRAISSDSEKSLKSIKQTLGDSVSYDHIRLVKAKYFDNNE